MNRSHKIVDGRLWNRHAPEGADRVCPGSPVTDWQISEAIAFCNKLSQVEKLIPAYAPVHRWEWRDVPGATGYRVCPRSDSLVIERRVCAPSVTRQMFSRVLEGARDDGPSSGPVQNVSWYDAIAFCNKLSVIDGLEPAYYIRDVDWETLTIHRIPSKENPDWEKMWEDCEATGYRIPYSEDHESAIIEATMDVTRVTLATAGHWHMGHRCSGDVSLWIPEADTGILAVQDTMSLSPPMVDAIWGECLGLQTIHLYVAIATMNKLSMSHGLEPAYHVCGVDWHDLRPGKIPGEENEAWTHAAMRPNIGSDGYWLAIHREPDDLIESIDRTRRWNFIFQAFQVPNGIGLRSGSDH